MKEITFNELIKGILLNSKEFIIKIKKNDFVLNSTNISEFEIFLRKNLKNKYKLLGLETILQILQINSTQEAYFPHKKSSIHFQSEWSKLGLPYSIKRLK